jgi:hypothetical protein
VFCADLMCAMTCG